MVFFIHLMKTGGSSFRHTLRQNFSSGEVFPDPDYDEMRTAYLHVSALDQLSDARRSGIAAVAAHFPFYATNLVDGPLFKLTVLRDPVERTISHLKHSKRHNQRHSESSLEEIYDDPWVFLMEIRDFQSKVFSIEPEDGAGSSGLATVIDVIDVDERRLRNAKANLETVDLIGLHEDYTGFLGQVSMRLGWSTEDVPRLRAGETGSNVSESFRRRIAEDNEADMEFYAFARALVAERAETV